MTGLPWTHPTEESDPEARAGARWVRSGRTDAALFASAIAALLALGIAMRLFRLGVPFDRNGYDEGAYWQGLRAMSNGHALYKDVFLAQPPLFAWSLYPTFSLFGLSLWSARFAVVVTSVAGLVGAALLGRSLAGRRGAVAGLVLLVANPPYLAQSQTIQAEAPSVAFSFLAVGAAYKWWDAMREGSATRPSETIWATVAGVSLALSIWSKLSAVSTAVPLALVVLAQVGSDWRSGLPWRHIRTVLIAAGSFAVVTAAAFLPYLHRSTYDQVYDLHIKAAQVYGGLPVHNSSVLQPTLVSLLAATATFGLVTSLLRRQWRVLPLAAWLAATTYTLWRQVPLFTHHLVILAAPLVALAVTAVGPPDRPTALTTCDAPPEPVDERARLFHQVTSGAAYVGIALVLVTAALQLRQEKHYFHVAGVRAHDVVTRTNQAQAADLRHAIGPGSMVVTDSPFVAGLADRDVLPLLDDPSAVRIASGYLSQQELISATSDPRVRAVFFLTGRFDLLAGFRPWVGRHFHLLRSYGPGQQLWIR